MGYSSDTDSSSMVGLSESEPELTPKGKLKGEDSAVNLCISSSSSSEFTEQFENVSTDSDDGKRPQKKKSVGSLQQGFAISYRGERGGSTTSKMVTDKWQSFFAHPELIDYKYADTPPVPRRSTSTNLKMEETSGDSDIGKIHKPKTPEKGSNERVSFPYTPRKVSKAIKLRGRAAEGKFQGKKHWGGTVSKRELGWSKEAFHAMSPLGSWGTSKDKKGVSRVGYSISWNSLTFRVYKARKMSVWPPKIEFHRDRRILLNNITGVAIAGRVLAIMGPSGSGKTTFLNILAGQIPEKAVKGKILVNGRKRAKTFKFVSSYVMQEDALIGELTVRQNLWFSAQLRLPFSLTCAQKRDRIDGVIKALGLTECEHTRVGTPFLRGISGGQKRRLSIGVGLLTDPDVIFLDEPTSGLDSKSAQVVMEYLTRLAHDEHRTVITTIHSPTSKMFLMFDDLMLLTGGRLVYHGPAHASMKYFASQGLLVPKFANPADFYLDMINDSFTEEEEGDDAEKGAVIQEVNHLVEAFPNSRVSAHNSFLLSQVGKKSFYNATVVLQDKVEKASHSTPRWYQFLILTLRVGLKALKSPTFYWIRLLLFVVLAFVLASSFPQLSKDDIQGRTSFLYFTTAFLSFMMIVGLPTFLVEKRIFARERVSGAYGPLAYTLAQTVIMIPLIGLMGLVYSIITYYIIGLQPAGFGIFVLCVWVMLLASESVFTFASTLVPSFIAGLVVGAGLFGVMLLFCGFFIHPDNIPDYWIWGYYGTFVKYCFEIFLVTEFEDEVFDCAKVDGFFYCPYPSTHPDISKIYGNDILTALGVEDVVVPAW
eukprot:CAMPEP_0174252422 /NCGR_PEP_ID=MMETSP0439-20130205/1897_1 /TAXON_ID=0 /ORGANISM="Stereomyxa ramosa, Strain Chinc5" /LENGTH=819 /DNA_ID=CAMNT_0015332953 /DNA_START=175 /DNA_END=2631 /DNA_ORIENTATION=-